MPRGLGISPKLRLAVLGLVAIASGYQLLVRFGYAIPVQAIPAVMCVGGCEAEASIHQPMAGETLLNGDRPLAELLSNTIDPAQTSILIEKSKHRLTLYYQGQAVKAYPVVFGESPTGDKRREGDRKTPEGILRIKDLYPHPDWSKFLWLDYPNPTSWRKHWRSKLAGEIGWGSSVGSAVGIHGSPHDEAITSRLNWTWGCPSLTNADVDEIYNVVQVGTIVEIVP